MKYISFLLCLALTFIVKAQDVKTLMKIYKSDGSMSSINVDDVDSISFVLVKHNDEQDPTFQEDDDTLLSILMEKDIECTLFVEALKATGLSDILDRNRKDYSWDSSRYLSGEKVFDLPSFSQYCHLPKSRETGFTIMACTNEALDSLYGIHDLQGFYDFARSVYGGIIINVDSDSQELCSEDSPLRKLLSYCIINRKSTLERLTTLCSIDTTVAPPTEWYSTYLPLSTLKVTRCTNKTFLNMTYGKTGVSISKPNGKNSCRFGSYYLTNGLPLYNEDCRLGFASERMRIDFYTLIPELENVMMRSSKTGTAPTSATKTNAISKSYYIPSEYLQSVSASKETYLVYENVHNVSSFYEGDGLWLCGMYEITFKIPAIPKSGIYELRLGYTAMPNNGMCQMYFGSDPQRLPATGIPLDFRKSANTYGGMPWIPLTDDSYTEEQKSSSRYAMRNNGYMHGPASIYNVSEPGLEDDILYLDKRFCDNPNTLRYIVVCQTLDENKQYYLRLKSVIEGNRPICLDYIELVNNSIYDNPEMPEDIY